MRSLWTITRFGLLEAVRARFFILVAIFGLVAVIAGSFLAGVPWGDVDQVILSLGWGALSLMCMLLAAVFLTMQISRDREQRVLYMVLARPVDRTTYLVGRWLSMALLLAATIFIISGCLWVSVAMFGNRSHTWSEFLYPAFWVWGKSVSLAAYAVAFAALMGQMPALFATMAVYFIGSSTGVVLTFALQKHDATLEVLAKGLYYLIPNYAINDLVDRIVHGMGHPSAGMIVWAVAYFIGYGLLSLLLAAALFSRRDLT